MLRSSRAAQRLRKKQRSKAAKEVARAAAEAETRQDTSHLTLPAGRDSGESRAAPADRSSPRTHETKKARISSSPAAPEDAMQEDELSIASSIAIDPSTVYTQCSHATALTRNSGGGSPPSQPRHGASSASGRPGPSGPAAAAKPRGGAPRSATIRKKIKLRGDNFLGRPPPT